MLGWHFVGNDKKLGYGDGRLVKAGKMYSVPKDRPLALCEYGLHASKSLIDALKYAPGSYICRVELTGEIKHGDDKAVAYTRLVISMIDADKLLHEFAYRCAEYALSFIKKPDPRSVAAIKAKRDWIAGKISGAELAAAGAAAWVAACDAAGDAAGAAAWVKLNKMLTEMVKAEIRRTEP